MAASALAVAAAEEAFVPAWGQMAEESCLSLAAEEQRGPTASVAASSGVAAERPLAAAVVVVEAAVAAGCFQNLRRRRDRHFRHHQSERDYLRIRQS